MRIGLLVYGDINTISGGYLYDRKLVEVLRSHGDEVIIISLKKTSYGRALFSNKIPPELEKYTKHKQIEGTNATKESGLDILIQDELVHPSFWRINHQLKKQLKCPIVSLVHLLSSAMPNNYYKNLVYRFIEKRYLNSIDGLILNSEETLKQANKLLHNKLPPNLIAVPCGDNFRQAEALREDYEKQQLKILFVGNITQQKGLHVLIKAMCQLDKNISLSVVGREDLAPGYIKNIKTYIKLNRLDRQIVFYGPLINEALQEKYLEHNVFVLPSVNEAYGIVFLEAMQFGMPVVGCKFGGAKEIINEGENGYLIDPEDSNTLAELINGLEHDRQLLAQLSASARQKYLKHPRWDESMSKVRTFLQELSKQQEDLTFA